MDFKERISTWKEEIVETVNTIISKEGNLEPIVLFLFRTGNMTETSASDIRELLNTPESKEAVARAIKATCEEFKDSILAYAFLSEGWGVKIAPENMDKSIIPSEHKEKFELILIHFESIYESETITYDIIRDGEFAVIGNKTVMSGALGRFTNLIHKI